MNYYVYMISHKINGKYYIGSRGSKRPPPLDSYWGSGEKISNAIRKYGKGKYEKIILFDNLSSREEAYWIEELTISQELLNDKNCYNMAPGGDGIIKHSEETKLLISKKGKGIKRSQQFKDNISKKLTGKKRKPFSKEWSNNIAEAHLGKINGPPSKQTIKKMKKSHKTNRDECLKPIRCIETQKVYKSHFKVNEEYGINTDNILKVCRGEHKTALGLRFEFITIEEYNRLKQIAYFVL